MKLYCMIDECPNFAYVKGPTAPFVTYTCVDHTPLGSDVVRFQEYQFDPDLVSGSNPLIDLGEDVIILDYETESFEDNLNEVAEEDLVIEDKEEDEQS